MGLHGQARKFLEAAFEPEPEIASKIPMLVVPSHISPPGQPPKREEIKIFSNFGR